MTSTLLSTCTRAGSRLTSSTRSGRRRTEIVHAAYLEVVERAVLDDFAAGHHDRGDHDRPPSTRGRSKAEQIEVSLLRLYQRHGRPCRRRRAVRALRGVMRDELGIEPPPLESL